MLGGSALHHPTLQRMAELYSLDSAPNVEILFRWVRLGLRARWPPSVAAAVELATRQGRMKFVRPLYRDLYGWEEQRQLAVETFKSNRDKLMFVAAEMVAKDLHINA